MQIIPVSSVASQTFSIVLDGQNCSINVYQKSTGLYLDLSVSSSPILVGVLCQDRVKLVRQQYLGFIGDLAFMDTQGTESPSYAGLGNRWVLMYLGSSDL